MRIVLLSLGSVAGLLAVVLLVPGLRVDSSLDQLFLSGRRPGERFRAFDRAFGSDDSLLVLGVDRGEPAVFNRSHGEWLRRLTESLRREEGVVDVVSLVTIPEVDLSSGVPVFRQSVFPEDVGALTAADRERLRNDPFLRGGLVTPDGRASASWVLLDPRLKTRPDCRRRVQALERTIRTLSAGNGLEVVITGFPLVFAAALEGMWRDGIRLALAALLVATAAAWLGGAGGRAVLGFVLAWPLVVALLLGWMRVTGSPLHAFSGAMVPIVLVTAAASFVHLGRRLARGDTSEEVRSTLRACGLAALTTAISFAVLGTSRLAPLRWLGRDVAAGTLIAFAVTSLYVCAFARRGSGGAERSRPTGRGRPAWVVFGVGAILAAPWFLLAPDRLVRSSRFLDVLASGDLAAREARRAREVLGVHTVLEVVLAYPDRDALAARLRDPAFYPALERFETALRCTAGSTLEHVLGPVTFVRYVNYRLPGWLGGGAFEVTPRAAGIAARIMAGDFPLPSALKQWIAQLASDRFVRFACRIAELSPDAMLDLETRLDREVFTPHGPALGTSAVFATGQAVLVAETARAARATQFRSLLATGAVLALLLLVLARSWRVGAAAIAANVGAGLSVANLLWLAGAELDLFSMVLVAGLLGVLVDDTIHLVAAHRRGGADGRAAAAAVGPSIRLSSLALAAGFATFAVSGLPGYRQFAWAAPAATLLLLFWDLAVLPRWLPRRR